MAGLTEAVHSVRKKEPREEKVAAISELQQFFSTSNAVIFTEYRGLCVSDFQRLRSELKVAGGVCKVYKNTLVKLAYTQKAALVPDGSAVDATLDSVYNFMSGPVAIVFVENDITTCAKVLSDFSKDKPELVIKGGLLGDSLLLNKDLIKLASLPSREVLLAQLLGDLAAPLHETLDLFGVLPRKFALLLAALAAKKEKENS
ncbi:MAG: 50S ribosomal protein L10 [Actinobacteria bacterium]|nr:50S ribosomal protein L10 [Actinomycetota bacterium]MCL6104044.1 50S ribosomal protein L10 [Actinomycetota bacterium]